MILMTMLLSSKDLTPFYVGSKKEIQHHFRNKKISENVNYFMLKKTLLSSIFSTFISMIAHRRSHPLSKSACNYFLLRFFFGSSSLKSTNKFHPINHSSPFKQSSIHYSPCNRQLIKDIVQLLLLLHLPTISLHILRTAHLHIQCAPQHPRHLTLHIVLVQQRIRVRGMNPDEPIQR